MTNVICSILACVLVGFGLGNACLNELWFSNGLEIGRNFRSAEDEERNTFLFTTSTGRYSHIAEESVMFGGIYVNLLMSDMNDINDNDDDDGGGDDDSYW